MGRGSVVAPWGELLDWATPLYGVLRQWGRSCNLRRLCVMFLGVMHWWWGRQWRHRLYFNTMPK